jgi:hypothetical protein
MRDSSGRPNWRIRALAIVVALLLAAPITVAVLRGAGAVVRAAF